MPSLRDHSPAGHAVGVPERVHEEVPGIDGDHLFRALQLRAVILAQHHLIGPGGPADGGDISPGLSGLLRPLPPSSTSPARLGLMQGQGQARELTRCSGPRLRPSQQQ